MSQKEDSMNQTSILITSITIGFVSWAIIANFWLIPWLKDNPFHKGLALLTIPHVFRYIGLSILITGVTTSPLDPRFAAPAAYGDLIAAVLALIAVMALLFKSRYSVLLLWILNILGFIDFLVAVTQCLRYTHPAEMGATYFIPILAVPPLFISHLLIFWVLISRNRNENT
jgi:hypothetical protein